MIIRICDPEADYPQIAPSSAVLRPRQSLGRANRSSIILWGVIESLLYGNGQDMDIKFEIPDHMPEEVRDRTRDALAEFARRQGEKLAAEESEVIHEARREIYHVNYECAVSQDDRGEVSLEYVVETVTNTETGETKRRVFDGDGNELVDRH